MARAEPADVEYGDEDLLVRLRNGERELFGAIVRRFQREVYSYLLRYTGDPQLAEDVFQNTFLQIYLKIEQYEPGRPVRPWIYRIATNQAIDLLRSNKRHQAASLEQTHQNGPEGVSSLLDMLPETEGGPVDDLLREESRERIRAFVAELPEILRSVVILAYYQEMKYADIAEILEIPVGTVKSRLHNALQRLQKAWMETEAAGETAEALPTR